MELKEALELIYDIKAYCKLQNTDIDNTAKMILSKIEKKLSNKNFTEREKTVITRVQNLKILPNGKKEKEDKKMQNIIYFLCKRLGSIKRSLNNLEEKRQNAETADQIGSIENEIKALKLIRDFILQTLKETRVDDKKTV